MKPLVSILITNYNKAKYITFLLGILLDHNTEEVEIIVIDDGSTDNSVQVINDLLKDFAHTNQNNITIIKHTTNKGVGYTKHEAIQLAKGSFFTLLDGDDFVSEDYIDTILYYAKSNKAMIYNFGMRLYPCGTTMNFNYTLPNKLFNREYILNLGIEFNTSLRNMDDIDLWGRLTSKYPELENEILSVNKTIYYYNLTPENSLTHSKSLYYENMDELREECK